MRVAGGEREAGEAAGTERAKLIEGWWVEEMMPPSDKVLAFAKRLSELRAQNFASLREFCAESGYDGILVYKWEEGLAPAPDRAKVEHLAKVLKLDENSLKYEEFLVLAQRAREAYRESPPSDEELFKKLPVAFRGLRVGEGEAPEDVLDAAKKVAREVRDPEPKPKPR